MLRRVHSRRTELNSSSEHMHSNGCVHTGTELQFGGCQPGFYSSGPRRQCLRRHASFQRNPPGRQQCYWNEPDVSVYSAAGSFYIPLAPKDGQTKAQLLGSTALVQRRTGKNSSDNCLYPARCDDVRLRQDLRGDEATSPSARQGRPCPGRCHTEPKTASRRLLYPQKLRPLRRPRHADPCTPQKLGPLRRRLRARAKVARVTTAAASGGGAVGGCPSRVMPERADGSRVPPSVAHPQRQGHPSDRRPG